MSPGAWSAADPSRPGRDPGAPTVDGRCQAGRPVAGKSDPIDAAAVALAAIRAGLDTLPAARWRASIWSCDGCWIVVKTSSLSAP